MYLVYVKRSVSLISNKENKVFLIVSSRLSPQVFKVLKEIFSDIETFAGVLTNIVI